VREVARNTLIGAATFLVPIALGVLLVGPAPPSGRTSESPTRVGHKALHALAEALGYEVHRFERGLESLPEEPSILIAIEPGPSLLRDSGRYAGPLARWLERGHAALLTLGPDPDHGAEVDDRDQLFGDSAKKAIAYAKSVERNARERAKATDRGRKRAPASPRRPASDLEPGPDLEDSDTEDAPSSRVEAWDSWDIRHLAAFIGAEVVDQRLIDLDLAKSATLSGALAEAIGPSPAIHVTRPRTFRVLPAREDGARETRFTRPEPLLLAGGDPILLELEIGRGKLLLLSEPRLLQNGAIARAAHARLAVRAIERLAAHAHTNKIYFEEFSHGAREANDVIALVLGPRARWPTLQILAVALVWVSFVAFRRRSIVPKEVPPRRSRHEVIDAMASLFFRAGDTEGAARRLIALSRRRIARILGVGAQAATTEELVRSAKLRAGDLRAEELRACLGDDGVGSRRALVERARRLRALRVDLDGRK
jgi:uncharacterized protein DUF4350